MNGLAAAIGTLVTGGVIAALVGICAQPAAASDRAPDMLLSIDGENWTTTPPPEILTGLGLLVPGESISSEFWVKNPTDATASLRMSARDVRTSSREYGDNVTVSVWNSGSGKVTVSTLAGLAACDVVVAPQPIANGSAQRNLVTFAMADVSDNATQNERGAVSFMVSMRDAAAGEFPVSACDDDGVLVAPEPAASEPAAPRSRIAFTGASPGPALGAAAALIGAGAFLVVSRRRRAVADD